MRPKREATVTNLKKEGLAMTPLLSLRGTEIPRLCFGTGFAILVEGHEIATHLSGARNDKANQQTAFSPLPRWERSKVRVGFLACASE
jgi:hypothetical protein